MSRHAALLARAAFLLTASAALAQEAPPLRTAVDGTFAPHAMPKLGGGYEGFNIDLADEIAKRLKRKSVIDADAVLRHRAGAAGRHLRLSSRRRPR